MANDLPQLDNLTESEREAVLKILSEMTENGNSQLYTDLTYADYSEIPVDIETFLHDKNYLGNALYDQDGRFTLFPYWEEKLKEIFPTNTTTAYNTIVFTGAIGLGKSTIAVICLLYLLYRLLCLKDPYLYYGLQPIDKITISLMNITIENAKGVALDKMNQMILSSSWFMAHGSMSGQTNLNYTPNKHIELITASSNNQVIGRAVFCLSGDTLIRTDCGNARLADIQGKDIKVISIDKDGNEFVSDTCKVVPTLKTDDIVEIELDDSSSIKCTPNHLFMLKDGSYRRADQLTPKDDLFCIGNNVQIKGVNHIHLSKPEQLYDVVEASPFHNFEIRTSSGYIVSHNCNFSDEVNWGITSDTEKLKKKYKQLISQIDARMKSRFLRGTYLPTLNIIASSKNNEQSFLEEYIKSKRENESTTTLIVDEAQWVVDSRKDSPIKFPVAIGNKFLANELLPLDTPQTMLDEYRARGYSILMVPIGYLENFQDNIDGALMDIAGIATASSTKYISGIRWNEIKTEGYENPFSKEVIEVGTAKDDTAQYSDFFDISKIPYEVRRKPMFIHLDMSIKGDKTGIAGVTCMGKRPTVEGNDSSKDMFFRLTFHIAIEAPKGYEISFEKNRTFIRWLKSQGFNIKGVSMDTFQSATIQQQLKADGFNVKTISVDRLDPETKQCLPYAYFKATIYDRRIEVYKNCPELTNEIIDLEKEADGHINHPENGTKGEKDRADAVCGATYFASQYAEEFAFEFGEDMKTTITVSQDSSTSEKQQIVVDFEKELQKAFDPLKQQRAAMQKQQQNLTNYMYLHDGILVL